jgi:hypothetical protein
MCVFNAQGKPNLMNPAGESRWRNTRSTRSERSAAHGPPPGICATWIPEAGLMILELWPLGSFAKAGWRDGHLDRLAA